VVRYLLGAYLAEQDKRAAASAPARLDLAGDSVTDGGEIPRLAAAA